MFHAGGLIVLCGLLAQTTARPADLNFPGPPHVRLARASEADSNSTDLLGKLKDGLSNGLLSEGLLNKLTDGGLVGNLLKGLTSAIPLLNNIIDLKVTNAKLLDIGFVQSDDGHRLYVHIPLGLRLNLKLPLLGSLVQADVKLSTIIELRTEENEDGEFHLVLGDCTNSPGTVDVSLLDGLGIAPLKSLFKTISDTLNKVIPGLLQAVVCPLVNGVFHFLDISMLDTIAKKLLDGVKFQLEI